MQPDFELVGVVATPGEGVQLFTTTRPGLTLMDLDEPANQGLEAIQQIRDLDDTAWVIALLTNDWDENASRALEAGAAAVITKDLIGERLLPLIRTGRPLGKHASRAGVYPLV